MEIKIKIEERWLRDAFRASADDFLQLIEASKQILKHEKELRAASGMVRISPQTVNRIVVVGDLHGDVESLIHILSGSEVMDADRIVFLGDYGDRGTNSAEVYYLTLKLKVKYGSRIIMLRGNHEGPPNLPVMPHDLPLIFNRRFGAGSAEIYSKIRELWECLPHCALVEGKYLMLHGGIPVNVTSIQDIEYATPTSPIFAEILWNDPIEGNGYFDSMRGVGMMFGKDITAHGLRIMGVKTLIRSHEPCEGVQIRQSGKVLTIFSRKGPPYFNTRAAYLSIDISCEDEPMDAHALVRTAARIW